MRPFSRSLAGCGLGCALAGCPCALGALVARATNSGSTAESSNEPLRQAGKASKGLGILEPSSFESSNTMTPTNHFESLFGNVIYAYTLYAGRCDCRWHLGPREPDSS